MAEALSKGDMLTVERDLKHSFYSKSGAIFEEISTEHHTDDSFYTDEKIMSNKERKSKILLISYYLFLSKENCIKSIFFDLKPASQ